MIDEARAVTALQAAIKAFGVTYCKHGDYFDAHQLCSDVLDDHFGEPESLRIPVLEIMNGDYLR